MKVDWDATFKQEAIDQYSMACKARHSKPTRTGFDIGNKAAPMDHYEGPTENAPTVRERKFITDAGDWPDGWYYRFNLPTGGTGLDDDLMDINKTGVRWNDFWFHEDEVEGKG